MTDPETVALAQVLVPIVVVAVLATGGALWLLLRGEWDA
jgi:hypothetical protein